ncbi:regulator of G-protein signaling 3a [Tachysurus ichikawai]
MQNIYLPHCARIGVRVVLAQCDSSAPCKAISGSRLEVASQHNGAFFNKHITRNSPPPLSSSGESQTDYCLPTSHTNLPFFLHSPHIQSEASNDRKLSAGSECSCDVDPDGTKKKKSKNLIAQSNAARDNKGLPEWELEPGDDLGLQISIGEVPRPWKPVERKRQTSWRFG